ncbi:MAG: hypothetical protein ACK5O7_06870 [Holosporales bacterium]
MPRYPLSLFLAAIIWTFASTVDATETLKDEIQNKESGVRDQKLVMKPRVSSIKAGHPRAFPLVALEMVGIDIVPPQPTFTSRNAPTSETQTDCRIM